MQRATHWSPEELHTLMMFTKVLSLGKSSTWVDWAVIVAFWNILGPNEREIKVGVGLLGP